MYPATFSEYALSGNLTPDETYTVELLIDSVRWKFDSDYYDVQMDESDAREQPGYEPQFDKKHVKKAEKELKQLTWLSLQKIRGNARPVRDLTPLRYLPQLVGLSLGENEIEDISPLAACVNLRRLHLKENPVRDISALADCCNLEWLDICRMPIEDFLPIRDLPRLKELEISVAQLPAFKRMGEQLTLHRLDINFEDIDSISDGFDSFEGFPHMPELRSILGATVKALDGLEKFPKLQSLINLSGEYGSLEPLRHLRGFTHASLYGCEVASLEPLRESYALRDFSIDTNADSLDLDPLEGLPALHEVRVKCRNEEPPSLNKLRASLESWDAEFQVSMPRHTPSAELEVVDEETFSIYDTTLCDTKKKFNIAESDDNEELMCSEHDWLNDRIREVLSVDFEEEEDYFLTDQWNRARYTPLVLNGEMAMESLAAIVDSVQQVLCHAKNDWIIYLQGDSMLAEFKLWVYPSKVMVAKPHRKVVQKLMKGF